MDVFSTKPGKTELIEQHIETGHTKPIKLPTYRVPQAFQAMVRQELKEMLNQGIIEPSVSEWAAPIVPIVKRMGPLDYVCNNLNGFNKNSKYGICTIYSYKD